MTTTAQKQQQQEQLQQQQQQQLTEGNENIIDNNNLSTFSFLPLQYSFGHRLKSTSILPPFSKLFFTGNTKQMLSASATHKKDQPQQDIIHDIELCMFYIKLDTKGTKAAICYLPTTVKNVIEVYHIEIPIAYRHQGLGDKLVKECLNWAKESGTLVIPTCAFVKRHLECIGFQKSVILDDFPSSSSISH